MQLWRSRSCGARGQPRLGAGITPPAARRQRRIVPRHPHVQTGFAGVWVPPPFVLPSAFACRFRSRRRRPGGAALRAARTPANAPMDAPGAADQARSRQDACTWEGRAGGRAARSIQYTGLAPARQTQRHDGSPKEDTPDSTMTCSATCIKSAIVMAAPHARSDARCRSRRLR
ncbi:hypothetical protein AFAE65S_03888 [Alcaligenes phenolicus]|uniref:Uncharacterized protein n=1 Tax=Eoetvoesiella caeni TaxID=645616 RepID=A0A366H2K5_9BURK|nr:hypothetical protein DFR37_11850 [Eoetvoesiella caeni]